MPAISGLETSDFIQAQAQGRCALVSAQHNFSRQKDIVSKCPSETSDKRKR